jgi:hypothetical protein
MTDHLKTRGFPPEACRNDKSFNSSSRLEAAPTVKQERQTIGFRPVRRRRCGRGDFCGKIGPETLASFAPLRETKVIQTSWIPAKSMRE